MGQIQLSGHMTDCADQARKDSLQQPWIDGVCGDDKRAEKDRRETWANEGRDGKKQKAGWKKEKCRKRDKKGRIYEES